MKRSAVLSSLLLLSLLFAPACDSDDPCADGTCEVDQRDETSEPLSPPPPRIPCRPACDTLLGDCAGTEAGSDPSLTVEAIAECIDWCEAGGLSAEEAACLEAIECDGAEGCMES